MLTVSLSSESARLRGEMVARVKAKKYARDAIFLPAFSLSRMTENICGRSLTLEAGPSSKNHSAIHQLEVDKGKIITIEGL